MQYIRSNRFRGEIIYSVFNSRGDLALYTRNFEFAQSIARAFRDNPSTTEVIVAAAGAGRPKRP